MRRSGSSSCLLKSKAESNGEPLSVTLLNTQQLPAYSSERFYLLSELEINGHSTVFLCDYVDEPPAGDDDEDHTTQETEESSNLSVTTSHMNEPIQNSNTSSNRREEFAPFLILYMLWTNDCGTREFAELMLYESIQRLQTLVDIVPSVPASSRSRSLNNLLRPLESPSAVKSSTKDDNDDSNMNNYQKHNHNLDFGTKLYLVVDRLCPTPPCRQSDNSDSGSNNTALDNDSNAKQRHFQVQVDLAEHLARLVASHSDMRAICDGITIGVSNNRRAAPGLESCLDAILTGAKDRRRYYASGGGVSSDDGSLRTTAKPTGGPETANPAQSTALSDDVHENSKKSCIGLVSLTTNDVLGADAVENKLQEVGHAAQGVLQCRVCAEWNGKGTILTFARRAHKAWRVSHNLPPEEDRSMSNASLSPTSSQLRKQRRRKQSNNGESDDNRDSLDLTSFDAFASVMALCFWVALASYLFENWRQILSVFVVVDDESSLFYQPPSPHEAAASANSE